MQISSTKSLTLIYIINILYDDHDDHDDDHDDDDDDDDRMIIIQKMMVTMIVSIHIFVFQRHQVGDSASSPASSPRGRRRSLSAEAEMAVPGVVRGHRNNEKVPESLATRGGSRSRDIDMI